MAKFSILSLGCSKYQSCIYYFKFLMTSVLYQEQPTNFQNLMRGPFLNHLKGWCFYLLLFHSRSISKCRQDKVSSFDAEANINILFTLLNKQTNNICCFKFLGKEKKPNLNHLKLEHWINLIQFLFFLKNKFALAHESCFHKILIKDRTKAMFS